MENPNLITNNNFDQSSGFKQNSKLKILLSVNAVAVLIAGILISSAIWFNGGLEFRVVGERSDVIEESAKEIGLLDSASGSAEIAVENLNAIGNDDYITTTDHGIDNTPVPSGELWNEKSITIYATPDVDLCIGGSLTDLGEMYWQTSDASVISGFYNSTRTWLGFDEKTCRFPIIKGTGTTTITAGTYDGKRKDSISVTVIEPPVEQWKREVLSLVNKIRTKNNLNQLSWGYTCESGAELRAIESKILYAHTRPDGSDWSTVCETPTPNDVSGENLAIGNGAVSPATTVALWMGSESHRANILNPEYTKLAVGFNFDLDSDYKTYWSQFFSTY